MDILVDPREGSKELVNVAPLAGIATLSDKPMPHGDVLIIGNGPEGKIFIGIEVKHITDFIASVQSKRLQATQLPNMFAHCNVVYVITYGETKPSEIPDAGWMYRTARQYWRPLPGGKLADPDVRCTVYHELEFHDVHCYELTTIEEVAQTIYRIAALWSKPGASHNLMRGFDTSSRPSRNQRRGMRKLWKTDTQYHIALLTSVLPDLSVRTAELLCKQFKSPLEMVLACVLTSQEQRIRVAQMVSRFSDDPEHNPWTEIRNIGKKTFDKVFNFFTRED